VKLSAAALSAALVLSGLACGGTTVVPTADLSESIAAQTAMAKIRERWESLDYPGLVTLEATLAGHLKAHEKDPSTRSARAMLAVVVLEKGDRGRALDLVRDLESGPEGASKDTGAVVRGALERREGQFDQALKRLVPLFNKIIDPPTRSLLNGELVRAALGAKRSDLAATFLRAYLTQSSPALRPGAEREAGELVRQLAGDALMALLEEETQLDQPDRWFLDAMVKQMTKIVLEKQDPKLARTLLTAAAALLREDADAVARVAARGAEVRLERNTVGLVMPLRSDEHRRRGVEVAAGLAFALGIPGSKTKLLVRDDQGDITTLDDTLALLNADGAAVIVAGYDTREADVALAYAERTNVPLVLLRPPTRPVKAEGPVFVLGEASSDVHAALIGALAQKGEKRIALLLGDAAGSKEIDPAVVAVQPCGASLDFVRAANAGALVLEGDPACSKAALTALDGKTQVAFGFDARVPGRDGGLFASAGQFPLSSRSSDDDLAAYRKVRGDPSWWAALGHDAGMLVEDAIVGLPTEEDAAALASALRKRIVADGIAKAGRPLWTTDAKGFEGGRVLARKVGATTLAGKR
jgi:hypothetical protein